MTDESVVVFLTNMAPDHNYEPAAKFGALRPVTRGNFPVFKHIRLMDEIIEVLIHSEKHDYLAFSGSVFIGAICLSVWLLLHRECKALVYDKQQNAYIPRHIKREMLITAIERAKDKVAND